MYNIYEGQSYQIDSLRLQIEELQRNLERERQAKENAVERAARLKERTENLQTEMTEVKEKASKEIADLREKHQEEVKEIREQLNQANVRVNNLEHEKENLREQNDTLKEEVSQVKEQNETLNKKQKEAEKEIEKNKVEIEQLNDVCDVSIELAKRQVIRLRDHKEKITNDWCVYKQQRDQQLETMKNELEELLAMTKTKFSFSKYKSSRTNLFKSVTERVESLLRGELD